MRYTLHRIWANNTEAPPAYRYSDLRVALPAGSGAVSLAVGNVFDQHAAPPAYVRYTAAAATERFGLPYRRLFVTYELRLR